MCLHIVIGENDALTQSQIAGVERESVANLLATISHFVMNRRGSMTSASIQTL